MTKVICANMMCVHNTSKEAGKSGECSKDKISFKYMNTNGEELEYLDCLSFVWDNSKGRE